MSNKENNTKNEGQSKIGKTMAEIAESIKNKKQQQQQQQKQQQQQQHKEQQQQKQQQAQDNSKEEFENSNSGKSQITRASEGTCSRYASILPNYWKILLRYSFFFVLLTINFISLSVSLNCNKGKPRFVKLASAMYAFFFGFIYLFVNYYLFRVKGGQGVCEFDQDNMFPF